MILNLNSQLIPVQHKLTCLSNGSALCSLWGTNLSTLSPNDKEVSLFTANARVRSQVSSCKILVDEEALWRVLLRVIRYSPVSFHQRSTLIFIHMLFLAGQMCEVWKPFTKHWIENNFHFLKYAYCLL
jgi:hypothetical protein